MTDALETLRAFPAKLAAAVQDLDDEALHRPEADGKWAVIDVVAHLGDLEMVYAVRMRTIVAVGGGAALPALAQNEWVARVHRDESIAELLDQFRFHREMNLAFVERLGEEDLARVGTHPEYGPITVRDTIARIVRHDARHFAQIERIVARRNAGF